MISRSQVQSAQAVIAIPFEELQYFEVVEHGRIHGWKSDQYKKSDYYILVRMALLTTVPV